jgi:hypothetical protein
MAIPRAEVEPNWLEPQIERTKKELSTWTPWQWAAIQADYCRVVGIENTPQRVEE